MIKFTTMMPKSPRFYSVISTRPNALCTLPHWVVPVIQELILLPVKGNSKGFPGDSVVKNLHAEAGAAGAVGLIPA